MTPFYLIKSSEDQSPSGMRRWGLSCRRSTLLLCISVALFLGSVESVYSMGPAPSKPLEHLDYSAVSDLRSIQQKHSRLMVKIGCAGNLWDEPKDVKKGEASLSRQEESQLREYHGECLAHLASVRRRTILRPMYEALGTILLLGSCGAAITYSNPDSIGGSFGASAAILNCMFPLQDTIRAFYNLYYPPSHPVDKFEKLYVRQQCFIPRILWPIITEKLMVARQNPFTQREALNFLSFTLGLTTFEPKPPLYMHIPQGSSYDAILMSEEEMRTNHALIEGRIRSLLGKIDAFFSEYQPFESPISLPTIRTTVRFFIRDLIKSSTSVRPIFLHGEGGVGKSFFTAKLAEWLQELLPNSISYESVTINSPIELEGGESYPGAFLQVLRNQCSHRTRGSVVVMDEAVWLNQKEFEAAAKRVFNGNLTRIPLAFFGKDVETSGFGLPVTPMLILIAANQRIEDENLRSRFDQVEFPMPRATALHLHAVNLYKQLKEKGGMPTTISSTEESRIEEHIRRSKSFRDVETIIPAVIDLLYRE